MIVIPRRYGDQNTGAVARNGITAGIVRVRNYWDKCRSLLTAKIYDYYLIW